MISPTCFNGSFPLEVLGDLVEFLDHRRRPVTESDRRNGPYPYYGANGIQGWIDDYIFDEPLVLLAEDGGHFDDPDSGIAYAISGKTWVNNHAHVLRPKCHIDLRFLCRILENYDIRSFVSGTTRGKLTKANASQIVIPVPPIEEQRRTAAILDKADALRQKRRLALQKLDSLGQAMFLEMQKVVHVEWISIGTLLQNGYLTVHKDGNHGSNYPRAEEFGEDGVAFLSAKAIADDGTVLHGEIERLNEGKAARLTIGWLEPGDVLLAHNASVGKVGAYHGQFGKALIGTSLTCFRPSPGKLTTMYLFAALRSGLFQAQLQKNMGQTTRNQVPVTAQRSLAIPLVSYEAQVSFGKVMSALERTKTRGAVAYSRAAVLFRSLQHRAFQGEL